MDIPSMANVEQGFPMGPDPTMALLDQISTTDPRLQMIVDLIRRQSASQAENAMAARQARIKRAVAQYERLRTEHAILKERNDLLASALGACPYCWGEADDCEVCHGHGVPGAYAPDQDAFADYVLPAVRRVRRLARIYRDLPSDSANATAPDVEKQSASLDPMKGGNYVLSDERRRAGPKRFQGS